MSLQWLINQLLRGNQGVDHTETQEEETEKRRSDQFQDCTRVLSMSMNTSREDLVVTARY